ncbi:nucleotidyl transferase AbiEii/AbiGii toxin family protein [Paraglaciecola sp. MB-3u-78]|jgi:predicted nucleotidyltransferase component of viral defense system|uniref:nucleotidyl transferase AbiEii/AbiGii toxin family protein n=1 Tax=Paraglaciecola sp. MB-3u-78 TaxID=2058332 RepID=UPI000C3257A8|nr:nucleotidyl transferase AbiEii/AbiGii toxin family protein [Paraglaciecola sp. MB-3u-78]PKG99257.1 hypothetical protein CXF95_08240 [Paraglaciecola sp. MB-3u-78]
MPIIPTLTSLLTHSHQHLLNLNLQHDELSEMFTYAAQQHKDGLAANFLEKDVWVTEILRLLYDEKLLGNCSVAFKGGTALSKCWSAIERFSEDIDLSIHWADLSGLSEEDEQASWIQSTKNPSQSKKFIKQQRERLIEWSTRLVEALMRNNMKPIGQQH